MIRNLHQPDIWLEFRKKIISRTTTHVVMDDWDMEITHVSAEYSTSINRLYKKIWHSICTECPAESSRPWSWGDTRCLAARVSVKVTRMMAISWGPKDPFQVSGWIPWVIREIPPRLGWSSWVQPDKHSSPVFAFWTHWLLLQGQDCKRPRQATRGRL